MSVWAVVVAAGKGARFGGNEQFELVAGRSMVERSVSNASAATDGVVLVVPPGGPVASGDIHGADFVTVGGETRSDSVRAGLELVPEDAEVIVVHDGARPLASVRLFQQVVEVVRAGADAAVPAVEVCDTIKYVRDDVIVGTLDRTEIRAVQTPQAFRAELLRAAHSEKRTATDDAALVEELGAAVRLVRGDPRNVKVTTRSDLEIVRALADQAET